MAGITSVRRFNLIGCFVWIFFNGIAAFASLEFKRQCQSDCDSTLLGLPLRGKHFGNCDWDCRVAECKYACSATNYSLIGTGLNGCLAQCAVLFLTFLTRLTWAGKPKTVYTSRYYRAKNGSVSCLSQNQNRTSACESGCMSADLQILNNIRRYTASMQLVKAKAISPTQVEIILQIGDILLEAGVVWRAQLRRRTKPCEFSWCSNSETGVYQESVWITSPTSIGLSGSKVVDTVIDGDMDRPNAIYEIRISAFLQSRLVSYSPSAFVTTQPLLAAPAAQIFIVVPDLAESPNEKVICWKQPSGSSPVESYLITASSEAATDKMIRTEVVNTTCYILRDMIPGDTYLIKVKARNNISESLEATITITPTPAVSKETSISTKQLNALPLFYANKTHIWKSNNANDYLLSQEIEIYRAPATVEIMAIFALNSTFYITLSNGNIVELSGDHSAAPSIVYHVPKHADQISAMAVNWLTGDIYLAAVDKIIVCRSSNASCSPFVTTPAGMAITGLVIEPRLGFLYFTKFDGLYALLLSTLSEPPTRLLDLQPYSTNEKTPPAISLDTSFNFVLYIAINSTIYQYDLINRILTESRQPSLHPGIRGYSNIAKLASHHGQHWWITSSCSESPDPRSSCLYGEEDDTNKNDEAASDIRIQQFTLKPGYGQLIGVATPVTPGAPFLPDPEHVYALFSDEAIRVTWSHPTPFPFQASTLDIPYQYNISLRLDGQLVATASINGSQRDHIFEHVQPRALYIISVKTCWRGICSAGIVTWGKTMESGHLLKSIDLIVANDIAVSVHDMLGKPMASYGTAPTKKKIAWLAATSPYGDFMAVDEANCLFSIDSTKKWIPTPFGPCGSSIGSISCFEYEPVGKMVYWCDGSGVYRSHIGSVAAERISAESFAQSLNIISSEALAVIHQPSYVNGIQLTGAYYKTYYTCATSDCQVLGVCTVNGFHDSRVYILVAYHSTATLEMHSTLYDGSSHAVVGQMNGTLDVKQMHHYFGKFLLLLEDGRLAVTEADLQIINYFPFRNVEATTFYIPGSNPEPLPVINITNITVTATQSGSMLFTWRISPTTGQSSQLYYNFTALSMSNSFDGNGFTFSTIVDNPILETDLIPGNLFVKVIVTPFDYWQSKPASTEILKIPSAPPSVPRNARLFVDHVKSIDGLSARVTFVWDVPRWNGAPKGFNASCWSYSKKVQLSEKPSKQKVQRDPQKRIIAEVELGASDRILSVDGITIGHVVSCQVSASSVAHGASRPSNIAEADTSDERPSTIILAARHDGLYHVDSSTGSVVSTIASTAYKAVANLRETTFAIREDGQLVEKRNTMSANFSVVNLNLNSSIAIKLIAVDWVGRNLYFSGPEAGFLRKGSSIWRYNLDSKKPAELVYTVSSNVYIMELLHDPFKNILYFVTYSGKYQLQKLKLPTSELDSTVPDCDLVSPALSQVVRTSEDGSNSTLDVIGVANVGIVNVATCTAILNMTSNLTWQAVQKLVIQADFIILTIREKLVRVDRKTGLLTELRSDGVEVNDIQPFSFADQPFPDITCLQSNLDSAVDYRIYPINKTAAQVYIDTSPSALSDSGCPAGLSLPMPRYQVSVCELPSNNVKEMENCKNYETYNNKQLITGLLENVTYNIQVGKANFFINASSNGNHSQTFNTSQTVRFTPAKLRARTVTPDKVLLTWEQPDVLATLADKLQYKVTVLSNSRVKIQEQDDIECQRSPCQYAANNLKPNTSYVFRVIPSGDRRPSELEISNNEATAATLQLPGSLISVNSNFTFDSLALLWQPANDMHVRNWMIQYARVAEDSWREVTIDESIAKRNDIYFLRISKLRPLTQYKVRLVVFYDSGYNYTEEYIFITNGRRHPRESGTVPAAPGNFHVEERPKNSGKKYFMWEEPDEGGSQIVKYVLEQRENEKATWSKVADNIPGSATDYPLYSSIRITPTTEFRLAAQNKDGLGKYAYTKAPSTPGATGASGMPSKTVGIIVAVCVIVVVVLIVATVLFACRKKLCKRSGSTKRSFDTINRPLPGYQRGDGTSHLDALSQISKADLDALPHVSRNCITASKPLGQGAFGEVYEGLACNLPRIGPKTVRVAIKTLKEGSPDVERVKFLKEAILMSKFRHPNIVQLLGVCLESEPHWIILELMEGGDLLTYLRLARPTETMPSQVTLEDLITLAIDVARGCSHLEQHRHVHRDLAARNCLLSSRDPAQRVVKIADFGMARDVYEGDYYRVEGHGLLPVRWMAPESMIDGVFTTKTDVWSFGVLLWEIMTLGQQPYPGRTNWDVLNYVRIGGQLKSPEFCPAELYEIMNSCWAFEAKDRPVFTGVVERLEALRSLPQFRTDIPFPPFYPRAPSAAGSAENSSSMNQGVVSQHPDGQVQLFVTQASGHFSRNTKQPESQSGRTNKLRKAAELLSFRKQKEAQPPPPPPSKDAINAGRSPVTLGVPTTPDTRPTSSESFTTSTEGYEVPLLKNLRSSAGGFTNRAYEPSTPGSMTPGPSVLSVAESEHKKEVEGGGMTNVYVQGRAKSPEIKQSPVTSTPRIKPNAPKPPLKPEVIHLSASPQSARRVNSPVVPTSYENMRPS